MNPKAVETLRNNIERDWERKKRLRRKVNITVKLCEYASLVRTQLRQKERGSL